MKQEFTLKSLFFFERVKIFGVTLGFHFVSWNEAQSGGIHCITFASRGGGVFENMAEVRITELGADFRPLHVMRSVGLLKDGIRRDRFGERWSSGPAIEFVERAKERIVGDNVDVDAGTIVVPIFVSKRGLGSVLSGDAILVLGQF